MATNQQNKTFTVPVGTRLSRGIELECLVAYIRRDDAFSDDEDASTMAPVMVVDTFRKSADEDEIENRIRTTLRDHGIRVREPGGRRPADEDSSNPHFLGYNEWDVGNDLSVVSGIPKDEPQGPYRWFGLELRGPPDWDTPRGYDEVRFVVNLLKSKYRLHVNPSCGFHVHVGNGNRYLDPKTLKRTAAFLFAADPMISRLHAPWRRIGNYSTSIRYQSLLACTEGMTPADADELVRETSSAFFTRIVGMGTLPTLAPTPWSDQERDVIDFRGNESWERYANARVKDGPFTTVSEKLPSTFFTGHVPTSPVGELVPASDSDAESSNSDSTVVPTTQRRAGKEGNGKRRRQRRRVRLSPHDIYKLPESYVEDISFMQNIDPIRWNRIPWVPQAGPYSQPDPAPNHLRNGPSCSGSDCTMHPVTTTQAGVAALLAANSGVAVGTMLSSYRVLGLRPRLNYNFRAYGADILSLGEFSGAKRTIEFREAGGSLDAEWIVTWAKICVGIFRFCRDATPFDFTRVLHKIMREETRRMITPPLSNGAPDSKDMYDICDLLSDICLPREAASVRRREKQFGPPR